MIRLLVLTHRPSAYISGIGESDTAVVTSELVDRGTGLSLCCIIRVSIREVDTAVPSEVHPVVRRAMYNLSLSCTTRAVRPSEKSI